VREEPVILLDGGAKEMGLPNYFDRNGRHILKKLLLGNLNIKGLFKHPLQLTYITKIFSVN
jgi:hypothetical protein